MAGLADWGPKHHYVKLRTKQAYEHIVNRYVGYPIRVDSTHEIEVEDLSTYKDCVKVTRIPFEITKDKLKGLLGRYGQVDSVIMGMNREHPQ